MKRVTSFSFGSDTDMEERNMRWLIPALVIALIVFSFLAATVAIDELDRAGDYTTHLADQKREVAQLTGLILWCLAIAAATTAPVLSYYHGKGKPSVYSSSLPLDEPMEVKHQQEEGEYITFLAVPRHTGEPVLLRLNKELFVHRPFPSLCIFQKSSGGQFRAVRF